MRLGTSTNLLFGRPDGTRVPLLKTLEMVSEAGFRVFDVNFYDWTLPGSVFLTDQWEIWIHGAAERAEELGITFGQCHGHTYDFLDHNLRPEERDYHRMLQKRVLTCCEILGAHTCVLHPETDYSDMNHRKKSFEGNKRYFEQLLEETKSSGIRIAIENMCDYGIAPKRKYGAYPEELLELVQSFQSERMGICWDFEHGDIMQQNQREALLLIKDYLFATHVSDTYSKTDSTLMHVLPMTGTIEWREVMQTLMEIRYQGEFSFEVHNFINRMPDEVVPTALKLAFEIGEHLMYLGVRE